MFKKVTIPSPDVYTIEIEAKDEFIYHYKIMERSCLQKKLNPSFNTAFESPFLVSYVMYIVNKQIQ